MSLKVLEWFLLSCLIMFLNGQEIYEIENIPMDLTLCPSEIIFETSSVTECVLRCPGDMVALYDQRTCYCINLPCLQHRHQSNANSLNHVEVFRKVTIYKQGSHTKREVEPFKPKGKLSLKLKLSFFMNFSKLYRPYMDHKYLIEID